MFDRHSLQTSLLAAFAFALLAPTSSIAQLPNRDTQEINRYVLTESVLGKYTKATENLGTLANQLSDDCEESEVGGPSRSLDDDAARVDAMPGVRTAIQSAGMTTREYLVFTFSLFQNGMGAWVLTQPGGTLPAGTSMANVNFYREHEAEFKSLSKRTSSDDCEQEDREEEEVEE